MRARQTETLDQQLQSYGTIARCRRQDPAYAGAGCPVHWKRFAAAAGATLAGMTTAEAAITHVMPLSPIRVTVYDYPVGIDLDGVAGNDLQFGVGATYRTFPYRGYQITGFAFGQGGASLIGDGPAGSFGGVAVKRFNSGEAIPATTPAAYGSVLHTSASTVYGYVNPIRTAGQFGIDSTGFAGFVNDVGGSLHSGWIKIRTDPFNFAGFERLFAVSVLEWAYETVPGASIMAGQTTAGGVPGDYSGNGTVGPEDYDLWKSTFGQSVSAGTGADGSGNGTVDAADYTVWRDHLSSAGSGARSGAVPEPSTVTLGVLALGAAGIAALRRRSK